VGEYDGGSVPAWARTEDAPQSPSWSLPSLLLSKLLCHQSRGRFLALGAVIGGLKKSGAAEAVE
jgi:hypothetical protein